MWFSLKLRCPQRDGVCRHERSCSAGGSGWAERSRTFDSLPRDHFRIITITRIGIADSLSEKRSSEREQFYAEFLKFQTSNIPRNNMKKKIISEILNVDKFKKFLGNQHDTFLTIFCFKHNIEMDM